MTTTNGQATLFCNVKMKWYFLPLLALTFSFYDHFWWLQALVLGYHWCSLTGKILYQTAQSLTF